MSPALPGCPQHRRGYRVVIGAPDRNRPMADDGRDQQLTMTATPETMTASPTLSPPDGHVPLPPSEHRAWLVAWAVGALGVAVLVAVLTGIVGQTSPARAAAPPPVVFVTATPTPGA